MNPSISVVIPVYNRSHLLKWVVESILAQTLPITEIILVDDGSIDDTPERLPRYIEDNPCWRERVLYFRQENQGPGGARNTGIAHAKGQWLAFNDNDDLWLPQKLEWQFRALDRFKDQCGACITDAWFMNNPRMKMTLFQLAGKQHDQAIGIIPDPLKYMLETNSLVGVHPVWMQTLVARTELARKVGGFDPKLRCGEDDDFAFRLGCETKFCFVNIPMVLIDRTPPADRHVGANTRWDDEDFRLQMAQYRLEKRLQLHYQFPKEICNTLRKNLAAVHSGWANWFLRQHEYVKARQAVDDAAKIHLTWNIAIKWVLSRWTPSIARKLTLLRTDYRKREHMGIG
jgi:glycosyltransferase involved in cell wall biosynthesis